ncbi:MAG: hypothetical protein E7316_05500 [Clostridiales bacterium]|nr:hypothetical protein [Clostridiales bacterium]
MQNTPQQPQQTGNQGGNRKEILQTIWRIVSNNWGFKLLALLLSIVLWAGLITQDPTLTREKLFTEVSINVTGRETLQRNGMIVISDLNTLLQDASLRVDVPQMQYNMVSPGNYNVRVDLSRIESTGIQEIKVMATNSTIYGTVEEISPESIEIEVDEYITRYRIPVNVKVTGVAPEGYYAGTAQPDPPLVAVSGPKKLVDQIVQAEAVLELGNLPAREGSVRTASVFYLLDEQGNQVESDLLSVTSESVLLDSVVVEQDMYSIKSMNISDLSIVTGTPPDGYEIKSVTYTPSVVNAAGRAVNLNLLDTLYAASAVDVKGQTQSFQQQIRVRRPTELIYLSADTITVEVEIGPVIQQKEMTEQRIRIVNLDEGMRANADAEKANIVITGPKLWLQGLRNYHISLTCDASGLTPGDYELPVQCTIQDDEGQTYTVDIFPATVQLTVAEW